MPLEKRIDVVYHLSSLGDARVANLILQLKTSVDQTDPKIHSLTDVWPSAEYPERETSDLMGVKFEGVPSKERLMLPQDFEGGPPLRKDFKLKTEGIDA